MRSSSLARFGVGLLVGSTILFSVETPVSSTILEPDVTETETATTAADTATTLDVEYTTTTELTENSEATTSALPTTTTSEVTTSADTTTTTSEASWPLETFALVSSLTSGPLMGMPDPNWFTYFGPVNPGYAPLALTIEPGTNRLQAAEGLYVCTFWEQFESPGGVITCDIESSGVRYIECTQANNGELSCRGEAVQCTDGLGGLSCSANGDYVTQFLVQQQGLGYQLFLGYGSSDEYSSVTLKAVQPQTQ
uniref:WGS project CBMI000000000 data, contig CS3069_c003353 n=1 Tax=Fusarium clavum TaxID=2594811 RepID=A0A090N5W6_9HYPO|nr:unnamed protein product [Fusarium clavum]